MNTAVKIRNPDNELIVTKEALDTCGAVSYWRAGGDVSIEALTKAWIDAGLDPKLIRKAPDEQTVLRRAVMQQQGRHRLVRGVGKRAYAVVDETVREISEEDKAQGVFAAPPTYTTQVIVSFQDGAGVTVDPIDADASTHMKLRAAILSAFNAHQNLFDPGDITGWLVKLAYANGAVTLRDSGGVYFIPCPAMDFWNKAAGVIESVTKSQHRIFRIPAMRNTEAIAAITDAITLEAEQVIAAINAELEATGDDKLGKRALESRIADAAALLAKVESYEKLVEERISVKEKVEGIQATLATAALA